MIEAKDTCAPSQCKAQNGTTRIHSRPPTHLRPGEETEWGIKYVKVLPREVEEKRGQSLVQAAKPTAYIVRACPKRRGAGKRTERSL